MTYDFTVDRAIERYLKEREPNVSDSTLYNHRSTLRLFKSFLEEQDIERMEDIDPFVVSDYRLSRQDEVATTTVYNDMTAIRTFIRWCEGRDILDTGMADEIIVPTRENPVRETTIDTDQVDAILDYFEKYEYATFSHALFALLWDTGIRLGSARSLDVYDFHPDAKYIELNHQPDTGTELKNGPKAEREVNLHTHVAQVIEDYITARRTDKVDEYGRQPLFSTTHGRAHRTTLRKRIVALSRPCHYSDECTEGRIIEDCAAADYGKASKCPASISPHTIRRSSITYWLDEGHSKELLSERMNVSKRVLDDHYDARSESQKRRLRRDEFGME